jgi:pSer/pThr/pTyr-binding forkhead associated (FHA) protein
MALLCLLNDDGSIAGRWEVGAKPLTVGRGEMADVRIDDDGLSRRHFLVLREGEDVLLKDLNSRNGTWLDGNRAIVSRLLHNDCIHAGRSRFLFAEREDDLALLPVFKPPKGLHDTVIIPTGKDAVIADLARG